MTPQAIPTEPNMMTLKNLDVEKAAAAIEADAGQALPGLRESLEQAKRGEYAIVHTPEMIAGHRACTSPAGIRPPGAEQDGCLEHADFFIGREFWTETGRWRCTDVGTRTICAISLEPQELTTLHPDGTRTTALCSDPILFDGPPYAIAERVFDETDFGALYASAADVPG